MSIDEAMENLQAIKDYYNDDMQDSYIGFHKDDSESVEFAIEIMRKYQKIEDMVKQYKKFGNIDFSMQIISGVVEDGKID